MRKNDISLGDAIDLFLKNQKLGNEVHEARMQSYWPELMGASVARQTERLWFKDGVLHIKLAHPLLRRELQFSKDKIREEMNKILIKPIVQEVILC
jgi:hypothetical protein